MAATYQEIRVEITAIEIELEGYALAGAIEPSKNALENILTAINLKIPNAVEPPLVHKPNIIRMPSWSAIA